MKNEHKMYIITMKAMFILINSDKKLPELIEVEICHN